MGAKASRPSRKLTSSISVNTPPIINRSTNINQLPSKSLKERYEQHYIENELKGQQEQLLSSESTSDESLNQKGGVYERSSNTSFDPSFLKKKLKNPLGSQDEAKKPQIPEGKDGFDPQVNQSFENDFINSITQLGKYIHSTSTSSESNTESVALKQLKFRKELYEKGQKELEHQMDPYGSTLLNGKNHHEQVIRTMVHPRTLGAILNDIRDPRVSEERIVQDYQLHPNFVKELGTRFKVATNTVIIDDKPKEGEIAPKEGTPNKSMLDYNESGETSERIDKQRLENLKSRISLDD